MVLFEIFQRQNLVKIYTKTHQIAPFKKKFSWEHAPKPPSKAHGLAMRSMYLRDMQISKSEKKIIVPPPLANPGDAPDLELVALDSHNILLVYLKLF